MIMLKDESLINELNFCFIKSEEATELNQDTKQVNVDNGLLIRGTNSTVVNRINAKLNFEFEKATWKRPPAVALVLDHIYGVQTSDRRSTIIYMHFHDEKPPSTNERTNLRHEAIKYDSSHKNCHKHLVYFTSRFGILYSPHKNMQTFYQGHSLKISCIQRHPIRRIIATGEVSAQPSIHVWDAVTLEPLMVLDSAH